MFLHVLLYLLWPLPNKLFLPRIRIRKKTWKSPGQIYLPDEVFGTDISLYGSLEFFVEFLEKPEEKVCAMHLELVECCIVLASILKCLSDWTCCFCCCAYLFFCHRTASDASSWTIRTLFCYESDTSTSTCSESPVIHCLCGFHRIFVH